MDEISEKMPAIQASRQAIVGVWVGPRPKLSWRLNVQLPFALVSANRRAEPIWGKIVARDF